MRFFLEGDADKKFIKDLVMDLFAEELTDDNFTVTNGYGPNWIHNNVPNFQRAAAEGYRSVIILDADSNITIRRQEILDGLIEEGIDIPFFLLPDNENNGNLESLLLQITNPQHTILLECFDSYKICISGYHLPTDKEKLFAYLGAIYGGANQNVKEAKRNYRDPDAWNIDSEALEPLRRFLIANNGD